MSAKVPVRQHLRKSGAANLRRSPSSHKTVTFRSDLQRQFLPWVKYQMGDYYRIDGVTPAFVKAIPHVFAGQPLIDPNERQNDSPTMRKMVEYAEKYNGTLEGYIIGTERDDARVTFDGMTIHATKEQARRIRGLRGPDEFDEVAPGLFRLWWD